MNMQHVDLFVTLMGVVLAGFATLIIFDAVRHYRKRVRDKKDGVEPPSH